MFSYKVESFAIPQKGEYYVIPFGHRCTSALATKFARLRHCSLPLDWLDTAFPGKIQQVLENDFQDFIPPFYTGTNKNKYDILFPHFNPNIDLGIEEMNRRIDRFRNILTQDTKKVYFVYIAEDYLYEPSHRDKSFCEEISNQMIGLDTFMTNQYPSLDYSILFFQFENEFALPPSSKIIPITLYSENPFFPSFENSTYSLFRDFCGTILTELFHTNLDLGFSMDIFYQ